jgi:AbrB family looped-hinge helix DNA binding protein
MISEGTFRKIDNLGRVVIPKHLRDKLHINDNDELEVFYHVDNQQKGYVCFSKRVERKDNRKLIAKRLLEELGIEVPEELK